MTSHILGNVDRYFDDKQLGTVPRVLHNISLTSTKTQKCCLVRHEILYQMCWKYFVCLLHTSQKSRLGRFKNNIFRRFVRKKYRHKKAIFKLYRKTMIWISSFCLLTNRRIAAIVVVDTKQEFHMTKNSDKSTIQVQRRRFKAISCFDLTSFNGAEIEPIRTLSWVSFCRAKKPRFERFLFQFYVLSANVYLQIRRYRRLMMNQPHTFYKMIMHEYFVRKKRLRVSLGRCERVRVSVSIWTSVVCLGMFSKRKRECALKRVHVYESKREADIV